MKIVSAAPIKGYITSSVVLLVFLFIVLVHPVQSWEPQVPVRSGRTDPTSTHARVLDVTDQTDEPKQQKAARSTRSTSRAAIGTLTPPAILASSQMEKDRCLHSNESSPRRRSLRL